MDQHTQLKEFRQIIDAIDAELLRLLAQRLAQTEQVGHYKHANNLAVFDQQRWRNVLETRLALAGELGLSKEFVAALFEAIHAEALRIENELKPS